MRSQRFPKWPARREIVPQKASFAGEIALKTSAVDFPPKAPSAALELRPYFITKQVSIVTLGTLILYLTTIDTIHCCYLSQVLRSQAKA